MGSQASGQLIPVSMPTLVYAQNQAFRRSFEDEVNTFRLGVTAFF